MSFKQTPIRYAARSKFTEDEYGQWILDLKARFRSVQIKAAVTVNAELLAFYWELGCEIVAKQAEIAWGTGFLKQLSEELMREFPEVKGFSSSNLKYIRQWCEFWVDCQLANKLVANCKMLEPGGSTQFRAAIGLSRRTAESLNNRLLAKFGNKLSPNWLGPIGLPTQLCNSLLQICESHHFRS